VDVCTALVRATCEFLSHLETLRREAMFPKKPLPPDYTPTERIVHKMLIENTGAHILDSGSIYGRHWERNRLIDDFRKVPAVIVNVYDDWVSVLYHVFHYIVDHYEYQRDLDWRFHRFANLPEWKREPWLKVMKAWIREDFPYDCTYWFFNTYNGDNILSQDLQGAWIVVEEYEVEYVILQTHNGCDIRGGYSTPHVFRVYEYAHMALTDIYAYCSKCHRWWTSDDAGYHWYGDGCREEGLEVELDPENNKVYHKGCGGEISFDVLRDY